MIDISEIEAFFRFNKYVALPPDPIVVKLWKKNIGKTFDTSNIAQRTHSMEDMQVFCPEQKCFCYVFEKCPRGKKYKYQGIFINLGLTPCTRYLLVLAPTGEICLFFGENKKYWSSPPWTTRNLTNNMQTTHSDLLRIGMVNMHDVMDCMSCTTE